MLDNESTCGVSSNVVMKSSLDSGKLANGKVKMGDVRSTFSWRSYQGLPKPCPFVMEGWTVGPCGKSLGYPQMTS